MLEVLCLEGNWQGDDLDAADSLYPLLELLAVHEQISFAYRDVATVEELEHYLEVWAKYPQREYEFGYLAFHGTKRKALFLDRGALTLDELGRLIGRRRAGKGKMIHLASCYGLRIDDASLDVFLEATDAAVVSGYTEQVDTLRAAAFELLLLYELRGQWTDYERRFKRIVKQQALLVKELGFRWKAAT